MKKAVRIILCVLIVGILSLNIDLNRIFADDDYDFANNEEYYYQLCTTPSSELTDDQIEACRLFRTYQEEKQQNLEDQIDAITGNISELKANIANQLNKITEFNEMIQNIMGQMSIIEGNIKTLEANIDRINIQIEERIANIEMLDNRIKERMKLSQTYFRTNRYIDFIMGASDFVELIRRINAVREITNMDVHDINLLEEEKAKLEIDKKDLDDQKKELEKQRGELADKKAAVERLKEITQELVEEYRRQQANLETELTELEVSYEELEEAISKIDIALDGYSASKVFYPYVVDHRMCVTSACYYYTGNSATGAFHAGTDTGCLGYGTPIYAVANGFILSASNACTASGAYLGNYCNSGAGNYTEIVVVVDDEIYNVGYYHLKQATLKAGDEVIGGQTIVGYSGNTGNSTGPHVHLQITYLGNIHNVTLEQAAASRRYGLFFGLANNITAACYYRNWRAPCLANPMEIYPYKYGGVYYPKVSDHFEYNPFK